MSQNAVFDDASIPVLTEVVDEAPPAAPEPGAPSAAQLEARALDSWSADEWELLEQRIAARILQQLQGRVDIVLEHALAGLTDEIRQGLQQTIEKIVAGAVAQEVAQLQTLEK
jgi:hypothetical protein